MLIKRIILFVVMMLFITTDFAFATPFHLSDQPLSSHPMQSVEQLVDTSDLIVFGTISTSYKFNTHKTVSIGKLYNYLQVMKVKKVYKGEKSGKIKLVSTGIEPLPEPKNPLNKKYPGPLASGYYILFLKKVGTTSFYQINGGWQGEYPYINDHTVSLEQAGFDVFNGLTLKQFKHKIELIIKQ